MLGRLCISLLFQSLCNRNQMFQLFIAQVLGCFKQLLCFCRVVSFGVKEFHRSYTEINRYTNSIDSIDVLYSANIKRESAVSKTRASGKPLQSLTDSTITVSDLLEIVKDKTPEILSSDVLNHFGMTRGNGEIENDLMFSTKREQLDIINETNPAPNTYSTWIRTVDDTRKYKRTRSLTENSHRFRCY